VHEVTAGMFFAITHSAVGKKKEIAMLKTKKGNAPKSRVNTYSAIVIATLVIGVLIPLAHAAPLTGRNIAVMMDERPDGEDRRGEMKMTLINKRGKTRERKVLSLSKDYGKDTKSIILFKAPADVKGTGFLSFDYDEPGKDDDRWLYLPALKKSKRISGSAKGNYFMGTDFTYDDMGGRSVDEDRHKLLREEQVGGHLCWVLESTPKDKSYMYSKKNAWIRKDALIALKVNYYDRHGHLLKTLTIQDMRKIDGIWTIMKMTMDNKLEKHKTILEFTEYRHNSKLTDSLFRISTLERGRIK